MVAASVAADGILVSDFQRVNHWSSDGDLVGVWPLTFLESSTCVRSEITWLYRYPVVHSCALPGWEIVLGEGRTGRVLMWDGRSPPEQQASDFMGTQVVCMSDWVYVLSRDRLVGYSLSGARKEVALPGELLEAGKRRRGRPYTLFSNGAGSVVVAMWASSLAAAVIDPGDRVPFDPGRPETGDQPPTGGHLQGQCPGARKSTDHDDDRGQAHTA